MILTKNNQTPLDLALEFVNNVRNVQVSPELVKIGEDYASMEDLPEVPEKVIFLINTQAKVSDVLLSWICSQSDGNPSYINTVLGMYATVFYQYHTRDEIMTLKWLNSYVGPGKILDYRNIFPYFKVSLNNEGKSVYTLMKPDDLYLAG